MVQRCHLVYSRRIHAYRQCYAPWTTHTHTHTCCCSVTHLGRPAILSFTEQSEDLLVILLMLHRGGQVREEIGYVVDTAETISVPCGVRVVTTTWEGDQTLIERHHITCGWVNYFRLVGKHDGVEVWFACITLWPNAYMHALSST